MKTVASISLLATLCAFAAAQSAPAPGAREAIGTWVGTWEGESICTVPNSPCHDEHVIYRVAEDKRSPGRLTLDADKVVNGKNEFMGQLECGPLDREKVLRCSAHTQRHDDWQFAVSGETMTGTLTVDPGKTLYRRIRVQKKKP